jgi:hypothetical protein
MYEKYLLYLQNISENDIKTTNFKSNIHYNGMLEHVTFEQGDSYLKLIENTFKMISDEHILNFVALNDKYGSPTLHTYTTKSGISFSSSPTSLRYIFHSLLILMHYEKHYEDNNGSSIVEVGCGYGGLFLAICYFSKLVNISIKHYHFVDFPEVCNLIKNYLQLNKDNINIEYSLHNCSQYGKDIEEKNLFFISNYCFTEINDEHRNNYVANLFDTNKINHGFIIWQTIFGLSIQQTSIIKKPIQLIVSENPQTATIEKPNYFVYF